MGQALYLPAKKSISASRVNPASLNKETSAFRQIAVGTGNYRAAARCWMVEDEVAARSVIQNEAVLLQETDNSARLDGGQFGHHYPYINYKTYKTSSKSRQVGEVENFAG